VIAVMRGGESAAVGLRSRRQGVQRRPTKKPRGGAEGERKQNTKKGTVESERRDLNHDPTTKTGRGPKGRYTALAPR